MKITICYCELCYDKYAVGWSFSN